MNDKFNIDVTQPNVEQEMTLQEFVLRIKRLAAYLRSKWLLIFLAGVLGGAIAFFYASFQRVQYIASLTFAMEDEKNGNNGLSGALGLASQFGLDVGSGAGGIFTGSNLVELIKSRTLVEKTLLSPVEIDGKPQSLAEFYVDYNNWREQWKNPDLRAVTFPAQGDRSKFSRLQDSILGVIYSAITGYNLSVSPKDKKTSSIIDIEVKTENEKFSKLFCEALTNEVTDYYVEIKSKKAKLNFEILRRQTDSIRGELNAAISGVARANDNTYNLNPALNSSRVPSVRRQVDVQANTAILTEMVKNLEMAKVTLRKETPLIQVIDRPIFPLKKEKASKVRALLLGGTIGAFLMIPVLLFRRALRVR